MISSMADSGFPGIRTQVHERLNTEDPSKPPEVRVAVNKFNFWYGGHNALRNISMDIYAKQVTAIIGPSGCGKSTFLRSLNRMNDVIPNVRMEGQIMVDGQNIVAPDIDVVTLRRNVGMVFQQPNPFPKSIFENIAYGLRINGMATSASDRESRVQEALRHAAIWDEVKERLHKSALSMSGGEQQRLCIARAVVNRPSILLADEPTASLDSASAAEVMEMFRSFNQVGVTVLIATHDEALVKRLNPRVLALRQGRLAA